MRSGNQVGTEHLAEIVGRTDEGNVVPAVHDVGRQGVVRIELSEPFDGKRPEPHLVVLLSRN